MRIAVALLLLALVPPPVLRAAEPPFTPRNPREMPPLTNRHSPAHLAAEQLRRGVNLGDFLEAPPSWSRQVKYAAAEFAAMRREGFDHVRVPAGWHHYAGPGPEFRIAPEFFQRVDLVVSNALSNGLAVIVNLHHFDAFTSDPAGHADEFLALWRRVAEHYAAQPGRVMFELLNEPKDKATTETMNPIYARAIAAIRETNPRRTLLVGPGQWNSIAELARLVLPPDDNLIVTVHCYEPFYFTHQGASWAGADPRTTGIQFPGPPATPLQPDPALDLKPYVRDWIENYNRQPAEKNPCTAAAFTGKLQLARQWSEHYGRPLHVGEFGAYIKADRESRVNYYRAFRQAAEAEHLGWAIWDWKSNFRYWDPATGQPVPGMREALFGK